MTEDPTYLAPTQVRFTPTSEACANSYHFGYIYPDDYYQENLVVSDLPAGKYEIAINYLSRIYRREIEIYPGLVTYFSFRGRSGFTSEAPPLPGGDFNPPQTP
jgi:hypothetical protein